MKKQIRQKGANYRKCSACGLRAKKDEQDFIRIVLPKNGIAFVDFSGKEEGRGAYVCRNRDCIQKLCKSRRLSHLLRGQVGEDVYEALRLEVGLDG